MDRDKVENSLQIICNDLAKARIRCKWSQKQIAEKVGCTQQEISLFEKGRINNLYIAFFYTLYFDTSMLNGTKGGELL